VDQRAAKRDALLHAAGELRRVRSLKSFEADQREQTPAPRAAAWIDEEFSIGNKTLSRTDRHGMRLACWKTMPKIRMRLRHVAPIDLNCPAGGGNQGRRRS